jgi:hypothetical protein
MFVTGEGRVGLAYRSDFINGIRAGGVVVSLFGIKPTVRFEARWFDWPLRDGECCLCERLSSASSGPTQRIRGNNERGYL